MKIATPAILAAMLLASPAWPAPQAPQTRAPAGAQEPSVAAALEYLLASSAADFRAHPPAEALRFHNVRFGHVTTADGARQYQLCGEFSSGRDNDGERVPFATIKTSGYEQWVGGQAEGLCRREALTWDGEDDLSPLLQARYDALH